MTEEDIRSALLAIEVESGQTARTALTLRTLLDVDPAQAASARLHMRVQLLDVQAAAPEWLAAVQRLPTLQTDRQHLQSLRWSQQLQGLPVWANLFGADR